MPYQFSRNADGTIDLLDPDGNVIQASMSPPVSEHDDVVMNAILDDVGLNDSSARAAIKALIRGIEFAN